MLQECALFKDRVRELADQVADGVIGSTSLLRGKKTLHFYKPTVERFGNGDDSKYYLIACEIFCLTGELKKLTSEEMDNLPVIISWKGPRLNFSTDEKECFKLITDIIFDFNQMQDQEFVSFPVGKHLFIPFLFSVKMNDFALVAWTIRVTHYLQFVI